MSGRKLQHGGIKTDSVWIKGYWKQLGDSMKAFFMEFQKKVPSGLTDD